MVVDDGGDPGHEGQSCGHVQVQMERLAEPGDTHKIDLAANFLRIRCSLNSFTCRGVNSIGR